MTAVHVTRTLYICFNQMSYWRKMSFLKASLWLAPSLENIKSNRLSKRRKLLILTVSTDLMFQRSRKISSEVRLAKVLSVGLTRELYYYKMISRWWNWRNQICLKSQLLVLIKKRPGSKVQIQPNKNQNKY